MASRKAYSTDLTDDQWEIIKPFLPKEKPIGRKCTVDLREVINATFYIARTGCQWRDLPHDFSPKSTVWDCFASHKGGRHPRGDDQRAAAARPQRGRT